jgi:cation diffusion facilitator CzcD-associated flavoprotein CzcO
VTAASTAPRAGTVAQVDAVVVGAGIAGLYQLYRLRQLGLSTRVLEAGDGVGGTWYWNRYPGARCDVASIYYSYSFSPELEQEWTWTERYPSQPEILRYVNHVADRFDLLRDITFGCRVTSAAYDDRDGRWLVVTDSGEPVRAQFLIMATGCLSVPKDPEVSGAGSFRGPIYHTGRWPHEDPDLTGLRLGVIGTGSSGIQSIPILARQAAELTVFQRTPNFSMPARNRPLPEQELAEAKAGYPAMRAVMRASAFGAPRTPATQSALAVSPQQRAATFQRGWEQGDLVSLIGAFTDVLTSQEANDTAAEFIRAKIREIVHDADTAELLSPRTFPVGTKRPCLDTGYYDTFNSGHVHLVDLRKTPLAEITETGVRTSDAEYELDAIVFATGFDAMTGALLKVDLTGRGGIRLRDRWAAGPRSYLGLAVAGFPNLFTVTGPSSPSVLSNMMVSIEQHVDWITDCIAHLRGAGSASIEATAEAEDQWVAHVQEAGNLTLFPRADSWYMGANVPGKPRVFMAYVGGVGAYRELCDQVARDNYAGFAQAPGG